MTDTLQKLPPQNLEAEQMVLGAVLLENESLDKIKDLLRPEDFYKDAHRRIYEAMLAMAERREAIDLITLSDALRSGNTIEKIGGASYLSMLVSLVPTAANIKHHVRLIVTASQRRQIIHACGDTQGECYSESDTDAVIGECVTRLNAIRRNEGATLMSYAELMRLGFKEIERRFELAQSGKIAGIPTGFRDLDKKLGGWQPQLYFLGADSGMGKSALADQFVRHAARHLLNEWEETLPEARGPKPPAVGVISLEMGPHQLALRAISSISTVPLSRLLAGTVHEPDWGRLAQAAGHGSPLPIHCEFTGFSDRQQERTIDYMVQVLGCRLIVFDYLQLGQVEDHNGTREQEVTKITRLHKRKIKQHGIPHIIVSSILNKVIANRPDKRPTNSDLKESGNIEFDADCIMLLYREEKYRRCECPKNMACLCGRRGKAELIISKGRMEGVGTVDLEWHTNTTTFRDVENQL